MLPLTIPNFRRVEERGAVIGFLTGLAFVAWIGWDVLSIFSLIKTFSLSHLWVGRYFLSRCRHFYHQNILFSSQNWHILNRFGGPKPPPVKLPVSTTNCTVVPGMSKYQIFDWCQEHINSIGDEHNDYNYSLQETLYAKSTTLLSISVKTKRKKKKRHISTCTGFGSSTRHIFWTGPPLFKY